MNSAPVASVSTSVYRFPTAYPEADGTFEWAETTAVAVEVSARGETGLGWTYSSPAAASVVEHHLAPAISGHDAFDVSGAWRAMHQAGRNVGTRGLYLQALSAVDVALWDVKAKLLGVPVTALLGRCRDGVRVYGSGGFTNQTHGQFADQVAGWLDAGCTAVKIKIGRDWASDARRVRWLRTLSRDVEVMVDANGAYSLGEARRRGAQLDELGVTWFEEPVSSDDVAGLGELRLALRCDVAAGEYVSDVYDAARLVPVVDCLQLDTTRCGGYTGFLAGAALAASANREVSAHCAPSLHAPVALAVPNVRHVEWFADHARLEPVLFENVPVVQDGRLTMASDAPGHGMRLSDRAAEFRTA